MHFVRFFAYIAPCLSVARATFSVTVGNPTQCDPLAISWTGGQAPFEILLTPSDEAYQNYSVPASAFSNGKGSYSISQLPLSTGTSFLLTMSDATGFTSGVTTTQLNVGNAVANNNCNTTVLSPPYTFQLSPSTLTQCGPFTVVAESSAVLPITIAQLIPGGQPVVFNSDSDTFTSVVDVNQGTTLVYFVTDSGGRQFGVAGFQLVGPSNNPSCLSANSPSSTIGISSTTGISSTSTASPTSSSSSPSGSPSNNSSHSNVAVIAGAAGGGGGAVLIALVILGMCLWRKRRASRSPDIQSSTQSHPRQLQRTDQRYEASSYSDVPPQSLFPHKTDHLSYHTQPIQPSLTTQSDLTNSSTGNFAVSAPPSSFNQTQHSRQSSNTDFPVYGDRSSAMSSAYNQMSQPMSPSYPVQYPVGYPPPVRPGSQSPPLNTSTGNFTFSDHPTLFNQTLHSHQSPNANFAVYGDARSSATMSSVDRRMSTITETPLAFPWETGPVNYVGPPIQSGSQPNPVNAAAADLATRDLPTAFNQTQPSHKSSNTDFTVYGDARMSDMAPVEHVAAGARPASPLPQKTNLVYLAPPVQPGSQSVSTSAGKIAVSDTPTPFNQKQNSRQGPDTDNLAVYGVSGNQVMTSASAQPAATAASQTTYQLPTQIIVHTDADDVVPAVVELPPQYSEHRGVRAL
ncbi:hypothetical protein F4604DRAFT_1922085 [Suillus subluteus]|nr:hypothetical protein F4604DRAFT_1922085 [Suillus subluteus]